LSDLLVIEFPSEEKAEGVRELLLAMQQEYLIELGDAVVAVKDANGRIKLHQLFQPVKQGAVSGLLWGSLIGLLFMMPVAGAAIGAASGAIGGRLTDLGINDDFKREVARTLQSGNAALFLLIRKMTRSRPRKTCWVRRLPALRTHPRKAETAVARRAGVAVCENWRIGRADL